jgi:class 3 adenylate cyclase/tetratricopeptide (TPR) repeat protein
VRCLACAEELPSGARFCHACGAAQHPGCASCGFELPPGARFCPSCGTQQGSPAGVQRVMPEDGPTTLGDESRQGRVASRRVTSVLFGDLVGFTTLAEGRDQEDVRELLSRYFETSRRIVERYGGVVEKFIGDAVMAVWGVPTANEDDAERAVRAALELVAAVAGLRDEVGVPSLDMRVGIVTGEVAVTLGAQGQGMVAGDAVNTAARVQSAAAPGQVWVDETTRVLTQQAITFVDVGEHRLKGKADALPLWSVRAVVAGAGGSQRADGLEAPLVGRDRELRLIKEIFTRTGEQGTPSLVILSGEPGVGKSRLAWEFEKYVDGLPATTKWHTGRCVAYGERVPYYALAEAIRARLRLTAGSSGPAGATDPDDAADAALALLHEGGEPGESPEDMGSLLTATLDILVPDEAERDWIAPRLGALLGVGSLGEFARGDLFAAWAAFLRRVGADAESVVLQIDDAEHADEGLVGFVEHLMASRFPVFVMMMARPGLLEEHPELARNPQSMLVNLAPLGDPDVQALLDGLVAGLPKSVREELAERSEGVPLYAVETVRSLIDRGMVVGEDGRYVLADREVDLTSIGAPASLQALITARLDALSESERSVVDVACVLGQTFDRDHLAMMVGPDVDLDAALGKLERSQLVVRETSRWSGGFGQYRFVQAVVPQVAYSMLARRDRRAAHLRAVEILSHATDPTGELAPVIAEHLTRAAEALPDEADVPALRSRAREHLARAADRALALGAIRESTAYLLAARELTDDPLVRARLDLRRGLSLTRGYSTTAAIAVLEPLVEIFDGAGDDVAAGVTAGALGSCLVELGRKDEARALAEPRWLALKDRTDADDAVVELAVAMSGVFEGRDIRDYAEAVMRVGQRRGDERLLVRGLRQYAFYFYTRELPVMGRLLGTECLRHDGGDPLAQVVDLANMVASWLPDDVAVALDYGRQAAHLIEDLRLVNSIDIVAANLANALFLVGNWDEARELASQRREFDRPVNAAALDFITALVSSTRGLPAGAMAWSEADLADAPTWVRAYGSAALAIRPGNDTRKELVSEAVARSLEYVDLVGLSDDHTVLWPVLFDLARSQRDTALMDALVGMIGDDDGSDLSTPPAFRAHRGRALGLMALDRGDGDDAVAHLRPAVELYETWGAGPLAARARSELGLALVRSDRPDQVAEGWELIETARRDLMSVGAKAWLAALDAALEPVSATRD